MLGVSFSIARTLYVGLLTLVGLGAIFVAALSFSQARVEVDELFDAQLAESARVLHGLLIEKIKRNDQALELNGLIEPGWLINSDHDDLKYQPKFSGHIYEHKLAFALFSEQGKLLIRSISGEDLIKSAAFAQNEGFFNLHAGEFDWRLFRVHDPNNKVWLQVAERADVRGDLIQDIATTTVLPGLFLLPIFALLAYRIIKFGLDPLNALAEQIAKRDPHDLSVLNTSTNLPKELSPLRLAFNNFISQLSSAIRREKRFTADAAHELRTPLAVMRIHAQNALHATSVEQQRSSLEKVVSGVDRTTRVVEQLLTLARLEPEQSAEESKRIDFKELVKNEVAALAPLAIEKQQDISFLPCNEAVFVQGQPIALSILVKNLLDNAIRYTPEQGKIDVIIYLNGPNLELVVTDSGPGLDEEAQQRVFERFYRKESGGTTGAGLGLSIVRRVTELHKGTILLTNGEKGVNGENSGCIARFSMSTTQ